MANFVNTHSKAYIDAAITAAGGTPGSGGATYVNTNPKGYIDAEVVAAGGTAGSGYINTNAKVYVDNRCASIAPSSLSIDPPVGPFTEVDGNYGSAHGRQFAFPGDTRIFQKLYLHEHTVDNLRAMHWENGQANPISPDNPIVIEDVKAYDAFTNVTTLVNGAQTATTSSFTLTVDSTTGFSTSGSLRVGSSGFKKILYYTGKTGTTFTGVTAAASSVANGGSMADNAVVTQSLDGTGESNLWVGTGRSFVNRVDLRRGGWMGLWTGGIANEATAGCYQTTFQHMSITEQNIGIYCEHDTKECTFRNFQIQASHNGIVSEWWYPDGSPSTLSGPSQNVFEDFIIDMTGTPTTATGSLDSWLNRTGWGIWLGPGTYGCTIRNGTIIGGQGIRLPNNRVSPGTANTVTNVVDGNGDPVRVWYDSEAYGT